MTLKIKDITLSSPYLLAPLAGFTDIAFRSMCREYGAGLTYTEMVSAKGLIYGNENTNDLLRLHQNETPSAVQIFGCDPDIMARAVTQIKADIIDINMGCPVRKIVSNGEGSALMKNIPLAQKVVDSCVKSAGDRPITVKFRSGFDSEHINALEFAKAMEEAGASALTLHARTREQFYSGVSDRELIKKVSKEVSVPFIANGDILSQKDIDEFSGYNISGYLIGRGALGNPEIFATLLGKEVNCDKKEQIRTHIDRLLLYLPEKIVINDMKKHMCHYLKGMRGIKEMKNTVYNATSISNLLSVL